MIAGFIDVNEYIIALGLPFILTHFDKSCGCHKDGNHKTKEGKRGYGKEKERREGKKTE